jgi:hypothetical protein
MIEKGLLSTRPPIQWLLIGGLFHKQMIFNNQLLYSRITKKQKSFDKFCLQGTTVFDRELHASGQSTFMIIQEELEIVVNSIVRLLPFAQLNSRLFRLMILIFMLLTQ